ncbi:hypothetical protein R3X25_13945 [Lutibacter sp. TH_r2]|uniref:hypothetical protein n=1 Tax=Lutibacter sp. TH_r2 TaxID=3082083 RepID=UPI0029551906|nr:hypothetical protein [Lutibacter sp. TH_r2]MDV7188390.1 hypothetical protein [Lutibacter sp. TH_r2]
MNKKYKLLLLGLLMDGIGVLTSTVTIIGDFADIIWAPLSAFIIFKMYKGTEGKIGGLVSLVEEAGIFGTDLIPTFTLTWVYKYLLKKGKD